MSSSPSPLTSNTPAPGLATESEWQRLVREKVESLRFGVVQLVIHDGQVTQIERTEKTRLVAPTRPHHLA